MQDDAPLPDDKCPPTDWSLIDRAVGDDGPAARAAMEEILQAYWRPLKAHAVLRFRLEHHQADDLVQEFITKRFLEGDLLAKVDRSRGKFRNFLLTAFDNFVKDWLKKKKPSGWVEALDVASPPEVPAFDQVWAQNVIVQALQVFRAGCQRTERGEVWRIFFKRVVRPLVDPERPPTFEQLARECGLETAHDARNQMQRAVKMFRGHLKDVVRQYTREEEEVESELRDLRQVLRAPGPGFKVPGPGLEEEADIMDSDIMKSDLWGPVEEGDSESLSLLLDEDYFPGEPGENPLLVCELQREIGRLIARYRQRMPLPEAPSREACGSVTLQDALLSSGTSLNTLITLKRIYRRRSKSENDELPQDVAKVLYLSTIASALLTHSELISQTPQPKLVKSWRKATSSDWIVDDLRDLLERAIHSASKSE